MTIYHFHGISLLFRVERKRLYNLLQMDVVMSFCNVFLKATFHLFDIDPRNLN